MNEPEPDRLEEGLRRISPAAPPADLMARLREATASPQPAARPRPRWIFRWSEMSAALRGLTLAIPAAAMILFLWLALRPAAPGPVKSPVAPESDASAVQVGHSLLASFDTVAQLPGGEPVRFRCREWQDDVEIHDRVQGVVISQSTPRVEVIPVRFETY